MFIYMDTHMYIYIYIYIYIISRDPRHSDAEAAASPQAASSVGAKSPAQGSPQQAFFVLSSLYYTILLLD